MPDTRFVVTVKHPFAWIVSMFSRPYHNLLSGNRQSIEDFASLPWLTVKRDNLPSTLPSVMELWNLKHKSYLALKVLCPTLIVRYEELISRPEALARLAQFVGDASNGWAMLERVHGHERDLSYYRQYYETEAWRQMLSDKCLGLLRQGFDEDVVGALGYKL